MKTTTILLLLALPVAAFAQESGQAPRIEARLEQRFAAADANGDGRLTPAEAQAGMPRVFRQFDAIDGSRKGYLTLDDIRAALRARIAGWPAGRGAAGTPP